jgi:pimeloyl-ACP methyl ester carboxylesterase
MLVFVPGWTTNAAREGCQAIRMQQHGRDSVPGGPTPFPALDGVTHRFVDLPGLRVHLAEAGDGEPVVLLHGFPEHWWGWRRVLPALAAHYWVIAPDLRGAGWTDAPADGYTEEQLVEDVVALLDALGLQRVHLVGLDIGTILGYRLCLAHPERVARFLAIGAPHPYPAALSAKVLLRVLPKAWRLWPRFAATVPGLRPRLIGGGRQRLARHLLLWEAPDPGIWSPTDMELYLGRLREPRRARAAAALFRALAIDANNRALAGAYRGLRLVTPTLALYGTVLDDGDRDAAGHPGLLRMSARDADDFTLAHVPRSGYYLPEEQPEAVTQHILHFLKTR